MRVVIVVITVALTSNALAQQPAESISDGQKQELLSAILCIDLDVQAQAKERIKTEKDNARASGGGIVDMQVIHDAQEDFARAGREAVRTRKQLATLGVKPMKCALVARAYNCINNRADQLQSSIDGEHCNINGFGRFRAAIADMRLDEPEAIESTRLYTFTKP